MKAFVNKRPKCWLIRPISLITRFTKPTNPTLARKMLIKSIKKIKPIFHTELGFYRLERKVLQFFQSKKSETCVFRIAYRLLGMWWGFKQTVSPNGIRCYLAPPFPPQVNEWERVKERTGWEPVSICTWSATGPPRLVAQSCPLISRVRRSRHSGQKVSTLQNTPDKNIPNSWHSSDWNHTRMASVSFFTPDVGVEGNPSEDQEESHRNPGLSAPYEVIRI